MTDMNQQPSESFEKIRQQYDSAPYPRAPLHHSPQNEPNFNKLFIHNITTSYYLRNQQVIEPKDKLILDAGCGSGYKSLILAYANPGARIVGIDISDQSVNLARQRLQHHGFVDSTEFHVLSIEDLPSLGLKFDYINCDEVLYFFPNPAIALQSFRSVLEPNGIIRTNLHNYLQRINHYRAQEAFKLMGFLEENPSDLEVGLVRETMKALGNRVNLKAATWNSTFENEGSEEAIFMNFLIQGDQGWSISDVFSALQAANLEFISMTNWRQWELTELFKDPNDLPMFLALSLPEASVEERLHLYNLLHPVHRLLDFWCGHPGQETPPKSISDWENQEWRNAKIHLHPELRNVKVKETLTDCVKQQKPFEISSYIPITANKPIFVESNIAAACLLPLWESPQSITEIVNRWLKIRPCDPTTLEPISELFAFDQVKDLLSKLEIFLYVLIEQA
jgi:2-polyprenyl-3-methyl-5-hydroxy-6-metoxy-1,4-benzoquinol methylase